MGRPRSELQTLLAGVVTAAGLPANRVYFQPPASLSMDYPCIRYQRDKIDTRFADDRPYSHTTRYQVTVIDPNPDSPLVQAVADLPMCSHERSYAANQLNHDVFNLFF